MKSESPKHSFLRKSDEDQDYFDNLIRVDRTAYNPGQVAQRVHATLARTRIMRGGLGSGKTRCAAEHGNALNLQYPGARGVIARKNLGDLKDTTQKEFLEKVVAPETIAGFNVNDNDLHYKNGSIVHFRETKDPPKFKSYEITWYDVDEADENPTEEIWSILDDRLRQTFRGPNGELIVPPYAGMLVFNPTDETHWLYHLAQRKDLSLEDFQFSTFDNAHNLPPDYIPNQLKKLAPWDIERLLYGNWGRQIKGKPVLHGFSYENNVRNYKVIDGLIMMRGWDFGYNHPACSWMQIDPVSGRVFKHRELLGHQIYLPDFVKEVKRVTDELCGPSYPIMDYGDPHGADKKDVGESSVEYLRNHHGIHVMSRRERVKTGIDEIQHKIITKTFIDPEKPERQESLFLVHSSCRITIAAYLGGYHRDETGQPVKDGYFDHVVDTDRYPIVHNMNPHLALKNKQRKYRPRNIHTGY